MLALILKLVLLLLAALSNAASVSPEPEPTRLVASAQSRYAPDRDEVWAAIMYYFPEAEWNNAFAVAGCESNYNPGTVGLLGERGVFQVRPEYHGPVPADIWGQVAQAAELQARAGWQPWTCRQVLG